MYWNLKESVYSVLLQQYIKTFPHIKPKFKLDVESEFLGRVKIHSVYRNLNSDIVISAETCENMRLVFSSCSFVCAYNNHCIVFLIKTSLFFQFQMSRVSLTFEHDVCVTQQRQFPCCRKASKLVLKKIANTIDAQDKESDWVSPLAKTSELL